MRGREKPVDTGRRAFFAKMVAVAAYNNTGNAQIQKTEIQN